MQQLLQATKDQVSTIRLALAHNIALRQRLSAIENGSGEASLSLLPLDQQVAYLRVPLAMHPVAEAETFVCPVHHERVTDRIHRLLDSGVAQLELRQIRHRI